MIVIYKYNALLHSLYLSLSLSLLIYRVASYTLVSDVLNNNKIEW